MIKVFLPVGIPGSGKSTWAKAEVAKDPDNWVRINNDDLRSMLNGSVWSQEYEKIITDARNYLIRDAIKRGKNVVVDNLNLNKRHFTDVCKIAKSVNADVQVIEKPFYIDLEEAIERDSKREGKAKVGEDVIKKWWKESGGKQFKHYAAKIEIFTQQNAGPQQTVAAPAWDKTLPEAVVCDLDGTLALIHNRSPYDASNCDIKDLPNVPVIETILAHYKQGRKIIFCSGREDKYRPETIRFIEKYVSTQMGWTSPYDSFDTEVVSVPIKYELHMRKTADFRKDSLVKEEMYENNILGKCNVLMVLDDRTSVVNFWREKGLVCFQVAPGEF